MDSFTDEGALFDLSAVVREAIQALDDRRPADAAQLLRDHLWRDPQNAVAYGVLGAALLQAGETDAAMEALDRAHYLQPANAQILYYYGLASQSAGLNGDASRRFEAALKLDPYHLPTRRRLAAIGYEISRDAAEAASEAALDGISELAPDLLDRKPPQPASAERPEPPKQAPSAERPKPQKRPATARRAEAAVTGGALVDPPRGDTSAEVASVPLEARADPPARTEPAAAPPLAGPLPDASDLPADIRGDGLPGVSGLLRATVELWLQHLLLWFLILALPNGVAAIALLFIFPDPGALAPFVWAGALAVGLAPAVLAMSGQFIHGGPFPPEWRLSPVRMGRALTILAPYALVLLGPLAAGLSVWRSVPHEYLLLFALGLTAPLHIYAAPAVLLAVTDGPGGIGALRIAGRLAGKRSWLHLSIVLLMTLGAGAVVAALEWTTSASMTGMGEGVLRLLRVTWLTLGESLWAAAFTLSGVDAVSSGAAEVDEA